MLRTSGARRGTGRTRDSHRGVPCTRELLSVMLQRRALARGRADRQPSSRCWPGVAERERFFHWTFEFPEVFAGAARRRAWPASTRSSAIRRGTWCAPVGRRPGSGESAQVAAFVARPASTRAARDAHVNLYLLFVERALQLLRPAAASASWCRGAWPAITARRGVRRRLFDHARVDSCLAIDNRRALFPIHRSLRLLVRDRHARAPHGGVPLRHVAGHAAALDRLPRAAAPTTSGRCRYARELLENDVSGRLPVPRRSAPNICGCSNDCGAQPVAGRRAERVERAVSGES